MTPKVRIEISLPTTGEMLVQGSAFVGLLVLLIYAFQISNAVQAGVLLGVALATLATIMLGNLFIANIDVWYANSQASTETRQAVGIGILSGTEEQLQVMATIDPDYLGEGQLIWASDTKRLYVHRHGSLEPIPHATLEDRRL